jgi:transcriptional regulator with XRE-family HTH domain
VLSWPKTTGAIESARRRAALLQHHYVRRIRRRLKAKRMSVAAFAQVSGSSYHRMSRLLRGEVVMRLEDIAIADLVLDEISEFAIDHAMKKREREVPTAPVQSAVTELSPEERTRDVLERARAAGRLSARRR